MSCVITPVSSHVTPNPAAPMDVPYARKHLNSISNRDDELIDAWIRAAGEYFEEQTGRPIMVSTWEDWIEGVPLQGRIQLAKAPLVSVTSVETLDSDGAYHPFEDGASPSGDGWIVKAPAGIYAPRGWIEPIAGTTWPSAWGASVGIRVTYTAGYATSPDTVPAIIKAILLKLVGSFDQFRSEQHFSEGARVERLPFGVDQMLGAFKYNATQVLTRNWP